MTTTSHHRGPRRRSRLGALDLATLDVADYQPQQQLVLTNVTIDWPAPLVASLAALVADGVDGAMPSGVDLPEGEIPWSATVMMSDTETGDGRRYLSSGGAHRDLPLPLMANLETAYGHEGAFLAGRIETLTLGTPEITGGGFFADTDEARLVAAHIAAQNIRGISADLDNLVGDYQAVEYDEEGFPIDYLFEASEWRIIGATVTPFPAFAECMIELGTSDAAPADDSDEQPAEDAAATAPVVAAGGPARPPAAWFENPQLDELTAPVFEDDGRCYGHLAAWHECHIAFEDACTCAPHSQTDYAYMQTGYLVTAEGDSVAVGALTLGTGHADLSLSARDAAAHYDNTGTAYADCAFGEDEHGIWFAGAQRPGLTEDQLRVARCSALSGDWRPIGGSLELVAALAVNVPGFPIPRARVASGHQTALVASAGARALAQQMAHQHEPVERAAFDTLSHDVQGLRAQVEALTAALGPQARDALRSRITT